MLRSVYDEFCTIVRKEGRVPSWSRMGFGVEKRKALVTRILSFDKYQHIPVSLDQELAKVLEPSYNGLSVPIPWYVKVEWLEHTASTPEEYRQQVLFGSFHNMVLFAVNLAISTAQYENDFPKLKLLTRSLAQLEAKHTYATHPYHKALLIRYCWQMMPDFEWVIHEIYHKPTLEASKQSLLVDMEYCMDSGMVSSELFYMWIVCKHTFHTLKMIALDGYTAEDIIRMRLDKALGASQRLTQNLPANYKGREIEMTLRQILTMTEMEMTGLVAQAFQGHRVNYAPFQKVVQEYLDYIL